MPSSRGRCAAALLAAAGAALGANACGSSAVSTGSFKGAQQEVAQGVSDLEADAAAGDQHKLCANDLAAEVVRRLGGAAACERALKSQLAEIVNLETSVRSVNVAAGATTATATVRTIYEGKKRERTVSLVKEAGRWKVARIGEG